MIAALVIVALLVLGILVAVGVVVGRLRAAVRGLRAGIDEEQQRVRPMLTELREAQRTAEVEQAGLQARVAALSPRRQEPNTRRDGTAGGYTAAGASDIE